MGFAGGPRGRGPRGLSPEDTGEVAGDGAHGGHRGRVVHAHGAHGPHLGLRPVAGGDDGGLGQGALGVLRADPHGHPAGVLLHLGEQPEHHHLLLEGLEDRADAQVEVPGGAGEVGGAGHDHAVLGPARREGADGLRHGGGGRLQRRGGGRGHHGEGVRHRGQGAPDHGGQHPGAQLEQLGLLERRPQHGDALRHPAVGRDEHHQHPAGAEVHDLDVAHGDPGGVRVLHDRDLLGELREQPHGALHDVVDVRGVVQQPLDGPPFRARERLDGRDLVDERAVALVRGDPARARVGGRDQALLLERGHVVAHGGRRDAEPVPVHEGLGADRLAEVHVVLHDGLQDLQSSRMVHVAPPRFVHAPEDALALGWPQCQRRPV
ncbi:Uncharacterised protein [Kocuria rosea]|nr:Uncharacterised protein [Kocuria rosea]